MLELDHIYKVGDHLDTIIPAIPDQLRIHLMVAARAALEGYNGIDCFEFCATFCGITRARFKTYLPKAENLSLYLLEPGNIHLIWLNNEPYHAGVLLNKCATISKNGKADRLLIGSPDAIFQHYSAIAMQQDARAQLSEGYIRIPKQLINYDLLYE